MYLVMAEFHFAATPTAGTPAISAEMTAKPN